MLLDTGFLHQENDFRFSFHEFEQLPFGHESDMDTLHTANTLPKFRQTAQLHTEHVMCLLKGLLVGFCLRPSGRWSGFLAVISIIMITGT